MMRIACLVALVVTAACDRSGTATALAPDAVTFSTDACFGPCPVFTLTVPATGQATLDAHAHMPRLGSLRGELPAGAREAIAKLVHDADFMSLDSTYRVQETDHSTCDVTVTFGRDTKHVNDYGCRGTSELQELYAYFYALPDQIEWHTDSNTDTGYGVAPPPRRYKPRPIVEWKPTSASPEPAGSIALENGFVTVERSHAGITEWTSFRIEREIEMRAAIEEPIRAVTAPGECTDGEAQLLLYAPGQRQAVCGAEAQRQGGSAFAKAETRAYAPTLSTNVARAAYRSTAATWDALSAFKAAAESRVRACAADAGWPKGAPINVSMEAGDGKPLHVTEVNEINVASIRDLRAPAKLAPSLVGARCVAAALNTKPPPSRSPVQVEIVYDAL
ncbi:MAG: DUF6438 domain-containing protein [Polyangiales bacterium]|nr:hypothetical protein [Myxococcales bacterium]